MRLTHQVSSGEGDRLGHHCKFLWAFRQCHGAPVFAMALRGYGETSCSIQALSAYSL